MRNIVGQTPRGDDFFPRPQIENRIYRRLEGGANIYLAAPRRVGKTAIMRHLEDSPRENYEFKYIITQSVDEPVAYLKLLLTTLQEFQGLKKRSLNAIKRLSEKVSSLKTPYGSFTLREAGPYEYLEELKTLLKDLDTDEKKIVLMIDEFPQTAVNILRKDGEEATLKFLQANREIRHHNNEKIGFILTGSIGLPSLAEKLNATDLINDLNTLEIPPFSREEAAQMTAVLLDNGAVSYQEGLIEYLLDKLEWNIPFHIQLLVQELIDTSDSSDEALGEPAVDGAFNTVIQMRNDIYFEHYYSRLQKTFETNEYAFATAVLNQLTQQDELSLQEIQAIAQDCQCGKYPIVLRTLTFDGYIFRSDEGNEASFRFTSPVLRLWWKRYVKADL